jgi:hypothetical protein
MAFCHANRDAKQIGGEPWHTWAFWCRSSAFLATGGALYLPSLPVLNLSILLVLCGILFWILFDVLLNILRNKPFDYQGDNIMDMFPIWWKLLILIIFGCIYSLLLNYEV